MPIKEVQPRKLTIRGQTRFRVIVPRIISGGRVVTRWFQTKAAAEQFARQVETARAAHLGGYDRLTLQDRSLISIALTVAGSAEKVLEYTKLGKELHPTETKVVKLLAMECLQSRIAAHASEKYIKALDNTFRRFLERFGEREAQTLNAAEIQDWLHTNGWEPQTKQGYLKDIRTLLNFAQKRKYITSNPAMAVERPKVTHKEPCILAPEDAERLLRTAERWDKGLLPYLALVMFGGVRPEEALRCRWEFLKPDGILDLPAGGTKNNKRRLIELNSLSTCAAWLALRGDLPIVNFRKRMEAIRRATAIKGDPERIPPITWGHDILRHSFVSYGVPIWGVSQTALLADHSEAVLNRHYRARVRRTDAERFWKILPL